MPCPYQECRLSRPDRMKIAWSHVITRARTPRIEHAHVGVMYFGDDDKVADPVAWFANLHRAGEVRAQCREGLQFVRLGNIDRPSTPISEPALGDDIVEHFA